jgi:signal transduction histidine kinase/CheY-like chemotaxis protein
MTDTPELKLTTPSGRHVLLRQKYDNTQLLITVEDVSESDRNIHTINTALRSGEAGLWYFDCKAKTVEIYGDYLDHQLTKRQMERVREEGLLSVVHPDDLETASSLWEQALHDGKALVHTCRILKGNGESIWLRSNAKPLNSSNGKLLGFICFFNDITAELHTNDTLRQAKETAEKALKAKNDFLARLSHQIRTPMNAVIGISDALIHHHADDKINSKLELIQTSAEKIVRIVDGTLDHTKLDADLLILDSKPNNPADLIISVCRLWEHQARRNGIELSYHISPSVPNEITFDSFRYEQCLNNLLSNAVKFTPNGKVKVVLTTVEKLGQPTRLVLAVQDNGIGMTLDQQNQIFDAFTQADKSISRRFGGTGLGMNITKQIIELMGGAITVRSEIGKGTIFALTLPTQPIEKKKEKEESTSNLVTLMLEEAKPEPTDYSALKILVADDNVTNHVVIRSLLETLVGEMYFAHDGQEAIDILETTDIDLVLMDIHMPTMDGIEATLSIRGSDTHYTDVFIIALTADPQYQQKRLCKNIGMDDALAKPVKLTSILRAIDNVLEIEQPETPDEDLEEKYLKSA